MTEVRCAPQEGAAADDRSTTSCRHGRWGCVVGLGSLASFLGGLNQGSVSVALPTISSYFGASTLASSWVLLSYMLALSGLVVVFGRLGDIVGRRRIFLGGLVLFGVASGALGTAPTIGVFLALRVLQGAGSAMMFATGAAIIAQAIPERVLGRGMGIYFATNSVAQLLGPVIGGVVAHSIGWQWLFWMNVPAAILGFMVGLRVLVKETLPTWRPPLDLSGAALGATLLGTVLTALSLGGARGWSDPLVVGCVLASGLLGPLFLLREKCTSHPIIELGLFRDRVFTWVNVSGALNNAVRFALVLVVAMLYQTLHNGGSALAGLAVLPISFGTLSGSLFYGVVERRFSHVALGIAGSALTTLGVVITAGAVYSEMHGLYTALAGLFVGLGSGTVITANGATIMGRASRQELGVVGSLRVLLQLVGVTMGTAIALAIIASPLRPADQAALHGGRPESISAMGRAVLPYGYYWSLAVLVVLSALGTLAALRCRSRA